MAIKLKKISRRNPAQPAQSLWYLSQETAGAVGTEEIAREIEGRSALSRGDVRSVLDNLAEVLPLFLKLGQSVRLEGFGTFRISVRSRGESGAAALSARNITGARTVFVPAVGFKRSLEGISYEISGAARAGEQRPGAASRCL